MALDLGILGEKGREYGLRKGNTASGLFTGTWVSWKGPRCSLDLGQSCRWSAPQGAGARDQGSWSGLALVRELSMVERPVSE